MLWVENILSVHNNVSTRKMILTSWRGGLEAEKGDPRSNYETLWCSPFHPVRDESSIRVLAQMGGCRKIASSYIITISWKPMKRQHRLVHPALMSVVRWSGKRIKSPVKSTRLESLESKTCQLPVASPNMLDKSNQRASGRVLPQKKRDYYCNRPKTRPIIRIWPNRGIHSTCNWPENSSEFQKCSSTTCHALH